MIWASERDNWRHLYLIDQKTGKVERPLTKGEWVVRDILHINEEERTIILSGNGNHQGTFSPDFKFMVDVCSRPDTPQTSVVRTTSDRKETTM